MAYAWFVYRFHMVATQWVLTTLEFAALTRFKSLGHISPEDERKPGLSVLLKTAQRKGLITNERFRLSTRRAHFRAQDRKEMEVMRKMQTGGIQELAWEFDETDVRDEDWEDWLSHFVESLPEHRNDHAHGTPMLHSAVLGTFEVMHDLISQLWSPGSHTQSEQLALTSAVARTWFWTRGLRVRRTTSSSGGVAKMSRTLKDEISRQRHSWEADSQSFSDKWKPLSCIPVEHSARQAPASVYEVSKKMQEP